MIIINSFVLPKRKAMVLTIIFIFSYFNYSIQKIFLLCISWYANFLCAYYIIVAIMLVN